MMPLVLCVIGTRPEAIKMAPVIGQLKKNQGLIIKVCVTGQHRDMLNQVLDIFSITPDFDLEVMTENQDLFSLTASLITKLKDVLFIVNPSLLLVHGDTTTALVSSLAGYYAQVPIGHVEAGLRTHDKYQPFPEEVNRRMVGAVTDLHFAPTESAKKNLLQEGIAGKKIIVTGNTVIDALFMVQKRIRENAELEQQLYDQFPWLSLKRRFVLITGHRRENFGSGFEGICFAILQLAKKYPGVDFVYPVHLNPNVRGPVMTMLKQPIVDNIRLIEPLDYMSFVFMLARCHLVLTDSGGIQEEAPSLGKPVLVMRDVTERPEAVQAGTVKLVGNCSETIIEAVSQLLTDGNLYMRMSKAANPYGDGFAAKRIEDAIAKRLT